MAEHIGIVIKTNSDNYAQVLGREGRDNISAIVIRIEPFDNV